MQDRDELIKERAHLIWEREGRGDGSHLDHWLRAEKEIDEAQQAQSKASEAIIEAERRDYPSVPAAILNPPD